MQAQAQGVKPAADTQAQPGAKKSKWWIWLIVVVVIVLLIAIYYWLLG